MASIAVLKVAALSLLLSGAWAFCEQSSVDVGFLFNCQVVWQDFYDEEPPPSGVEVRYSISLDVAAGMPKWLTLMQSEQQSAAAPAFLYGTPQQEDLGQITLQASLTRLDTLQKALREMIITVQQPQGKIFQLAEYYVINYTVEEFLNSSVIGRFQQTLTLVYQQGGAAVTKVINPIERGILVPPPPNKHGVIVQITPGINVTMTTSDETSLVQKNCSSREQLSPPPMNFELFSRDGFEIDWCHFVTSLFLDNPDQQSSRPSQPYPVPDQQQPSGDGSKVSLIVVMALGFVIIIMVVSGLAMVFFGRRRTSVSRRQRHHRDTMKHHVEEDARGPSTAQKHLRDLARSQPAKVRDKDIQAEPIMYSGEEGGLLEFQDVVDYGNRHESSNREEQTPPPEYTYDEELLNRPLYEPGKRSRLITI